MRLVTTVALLALSTAIATVHAAVHSINGDQFVSLVAGEPIKGIDTEADPWFGARHLGVWIVRFTMPWEAVATNQSNAFVAASESIPASIARFAELPLATTDDLFVADSLLIAALPHIRVFNGKVGRVNIPRGAILSDRPIHINAGYSGSHDDVAAITGFTLEQIPNSYADSVTSEVVPSATVVSTKKDLVAAMQRGSPKTAIAVATSTKNALSKATILAAAFAAGSMNRGRGDVQIFVLTGATFSDVAVSGFDFTLATIKVDGAEPRFSDAVGSNAVEDIATTVFKRADSVQKPADFAAAQASAIAEARLGAARFIAPTNLDALNQHSLRRLDTTEQFMKQVTELKNGVAVIFFVRESDRMYSKHLKIAKKVAETAVWDFSANVPGQAGSTLRYEVFLVDVDVHKQVAKDLRVDRVPSVGCMLELREHAGKKGLRFYKAKDGLDKAEAINKWMRNEIFDGREMVIVDPSIVTFAATVPPSALDLSLQTHFFDTNPRRFRHAASSDPTDAYSRALEDAKTASATAANPGKGAGKKGAGKQNETPQEAAKREAREAKQRDLAEKRKAKLKAELEAKEAAKKQRMADKGAVEKEAADKRKAEAEKRAAEEKERRAREEADGTAERRRAAARAKKARAERAAKLKKAKLAAKQKKDRATLTKMWAEDGNIAAKKHYTVADDGTVTIIDRIL